MEKKEIKGNLEAYKFWLIGEDYEPEPKITVELIDSMLKVLETPPNLDNLLEFAKEKGLIESWIENNFNCDLGLDSDERIRTDYGYLPEIFVSYTKFIIDKLKELGNEKSAKKVNLFNLD